MTIPVITLAAITEIPLRTLQLLLLCAAAFILYVMGRLTLGAIPARIDRPALRVLITTLTTLAVSIVAVFLGRPNVALHLPIAAATCAMTFGVAALIVGRSTTPFTSNRSWALLAPAVLMLVLGGSVGRLDGYLVGSLVVYGLLALLAWQSDAKPDAVLRAPDPVSAAQGKVLDYRGQEASGSGAKSSSFSILLFVGAVPLAVLAGVLAMYGLPVLENSTRWSADSLATVFLIAPAIVVPMFFELLPPCRTIGFSGGMTALSKFALVSLCVTLPIVALVQAELPVLRSMWAAAPTSIASGPHPATLPATYPATLPTSLPASHPTLPASHPTTLLTSPAAPSIDWPDVPAVALRADLLVLAAAVLLLVPIAAGWLKPTKVEATALILCYLFNLFLVMAAMVT